MSKSLKCVSIVVVLLLLLLSFGACSDKNRQAPTRGSLSISVTPEFAALTKTLANDFSKRFMVAMDVKIVESEKLWSMEENSDFLVGVEREKAVKAANIKNSGWQMALWISDDVVLAVRKNEVFGVRKARDLQQPIINPVALPSHREEIGRRAQELFDYWKVRNILQPRIRITPDSATAIKMLKSGEVRAAVVPAHLTALDPALKQVFSFSPLAHQSMRKAAVRCPRALNNSAADEFERVLGTEGAAAFLQAGYKASDSDF